MADGTNYISFIVKNEFTDKDMSCLSQNHPVERWQEINDKT